MDGGQPRYRAPRKAAGRSRGADPEEPAEGSRDRKGVIFLTEKTRCDSRQGAIPDLHSCSLSVLCLSLSSQSGISHPLTLGIPLCTLHTHSRTDPAVITDVAE